MKRELLIGSPYIVSENGKARLCAELSIDGKTVYTAWYDVEEEFEKYLCSERSDAFLVSLILYAMREDMNIKCIAPVSKRLLYQLVSFIIPFYANTSKTYNHIEIFANSTIENLETAKAVGTGISCGIDSLYSVFKNNAEDSEYKVTHLCLFNNGTFGDFGGDEARKSYLKQLNFSKNISEKLGKKFVGVDTNINEFIKMIHYETHVFRSISFVMALSKLFGTYYFASSYRIDELKPNINHFDSLELYNLSNLQTETLSLYSSGLEVTRLEKVEFLSDIEFVHNSLSVCFFEDVNCCKCEKCKRTIMQLYILGKLDKFDKVFDMELVKNSFDSCFIDSIAMKENVFWRPIYEYLKLNHKYKLKHYIIGFAKSSALKNREKFLKLLNNKFILTRYKKIKEKYNWR